MSRPLVTSLRLNNDVPVAEFVELARLAESLEFDQIWVSNDLFFRSAPVLLAAAATATCRIALGTCILNPYSMHPAEIAMTATTLQELSGGRFLLGLAAGADDFLGWAGIARHAPLARTREAVDRHPRAVLRSCRRPTSRAAATAGSVTHACASRRRRHRSTSGRWRHGCWR